MSEVITAWHFLGKDFCLRFPPHTKIEVGVELEFDGRPALCQQGYHASERLIDALNYAPGPILTHCELSGEIVRGEDKLVATKRKVLWMADISTLLHEFACDEAERALNARKGNKTDPRSYAAIEAKRKWLNGAISDQELDAAQAAALAAARGAAQAAWAAAWAAARDAALAAAWAAARAAQNDRLTSRVMGMME